MRSTFPHASYPACGDDRMYDLHHGLLGLALERLLFETGPVLCLLAGIEATARLKTVGVRRIGFATSRLA